MRKRFYCFMAGILVLQAAALATFVQPLPAPLHFVPVERLIANTAAYIKEHPSDPMGPYTLARIHYFAFVADGASLQTTASASLPVVEKTLPSSSNLARGLTADERLHRLNSSVENYRKALSMDSKNALFHLGLASVSEAAFYSGAKVGPLPGRGPAGTRADDFPAQWREQAIASYRTAFELTVENDLKLKTRPPVVDLPGLISWEAAQHYRSMVKDRGVRTEEESVLKKVQKALDTLVAKPFPEKPEHKLPRGAVTPIIFNLDEARALSGLLDRRRVVSFDLDGTERPQRYNWVRPDTGILVWDPKNSGAITSGHQLFGSVTFKMFWSDGYRAMDALDDNRDGQLAGKELDGLAVWFDHNQDGVSQPGETVPIAKTSIVAIAARAAGRSGESLMNPKGITCADGRVLPSYDWTTAALMGGPTS